MVIGNKAVYCRGALFNYYIASITLQLCTVAALTVSVVRPNDCWECGDKLATQKCIRYWLNLYTFIDVSQCAHPIILKPSRCTMDIQS